MKATVTISRKWNNPQITTCISDESINLSITLEDFVVALKQEIGSVATTFTRNTFETKVDTAIAKILSAIKEESTKTIH